MGQCRVVKFLSAGFYNTEMEHHQGLSKRSEVFHLQYLRILCTLHGPHTNNVKHNWRYPGDVVMLPSLHTDTALHGFIIWHFIPSLFTYIYFVRYLACSIIFVKYETRCMRFVKRLLLWFFLRASCVTHNDDVKLQCGQGYSCLVCRATARTKPVCKKISLIHSKRIKFHVRFAKKKKLLCSPA